MKKKLLLLFLFTSPFFVLSQTISGKLENSNGEKIAFANVVTKDSVNARSIREFVIARNGVYSIMLTKQYKQLVVEVSANRYQKVVWVIDSFIATQNYTHHFILAEDTVKSLNEVIVTAKVRPFQIKGDTVSYNVATYKDGSERKIQDLIKKLPGIVVNEKTGEIRYKGKPVETVKLDGEDLFAANYTIGTKNINVDMVEQVEAIENYSNNPLLKGIENSDKVALNLTLKKKKADYSGTVDIGLGMLGKETAKDASATILGVSKKYKSFATVSYNNVGLNNTPFDYFSYNPDIDQLIEQGLLAKKYIPDIYYDTEIDPQRSNINNSFFGSYNAAFKLGSKLNLKTNFYYLTDKISSEQMNESLYNINGQKFTVYDRYFSQKNPLQYRGDVEAKYHTSKTSLLEYSARYKDENINTPNEVLQNNTTAYHTRLKTNDEYFKQKLIYTNKIPNNKAVQITAQHSSNNLPQSYSFLPAVYDSANYHSNLETSLFKKNTYLIQSNFLGKNSMGKYNLALGIQMQHIDYISGLKGINDTDTTLMNGFANSFNYKRTASFLSGNFNFRYKRLGISPAFKLTHLSQHLINKVQLKHADTISILIEPAISFAYKLNNYSALSLTTGYGQKPFSEEYLVSNPLYISSRYIRSNEVGLYNQQSKFVSVFYLVNNLYKQLQINLGSSYSTNKGNYFSNLTISQNSTRATYFFLPEYATQFSANLMIEKYIPFLQGTVRWKNDYSLQRYKNIINVSSLRKNITQTISNELFFKTAFDKGINFENTFKHLFVNAKQEGSNGFNNSSFNNNFKIIVKPSSSIFAIFSLDYFFPNSTKKQNFLFVDMDLTYQPKNKSYGLRFAARNISNIKTLNQIDIDDYSINKFQTNLLSRHITISLSRSF